jgi:putative N6-adenine-specific DNA methylase
MSSSPTFEIFLVAIPGLEAALTDEARACGFQGAKQVPGGVRFDGGWPEVWRANLQLRGASRVLARIGSFHAAHLAQLDKRARAFPWRTILRRDVAVSVETTCKKSKIYHSGAATQRIATAINEELGATISDDADVVIKARIESDLLTLSIDTSGGLLHKRGSKQATAKAPLRETMAALFLRQCGYTGHEPVLDPMCGSGTFIIEAAEIALGLAPGRNRRFAFEHLATFDAKAWEKMKSENLFIPPGEGTSQIFSPPQKEGQPRVQFYGSDRDAGAIKSSKANTERAGVSTNTTFMQRPVSEVTPPDGPPGLVICNPPYGARIGDKKPLHDLYAAFGQTMKSRFKGWRVGLITSDPKLARSTGLPFKAKPAAVLHGGLRVYLFQTGALL